MNILQKFQLKPLSKYVFYSSSEGREQLASQSCYNFTNIQMFYYTSLKISVQQSIKTVCQPAFFQYSSFLYYPVSKVWQKLYTPSAIPTVLHFCQRATSLGMQATILAYWMSISMGFLLGETRVGSQINSSPMLKPFIKVRILGLEQNNYKSFPQKLQMNREYQFLNIKVNKFWFNSIWSLLQLVYHSWSINQHLNYKMPKLKKHSEKKSKNKPTNDEEITKDKEQDPVEESSLNASLVRPKRMKMRQRVKMFEDSEEQAQKKTQKRYFKPQQESKQYKDNNQVEIILSKYTDDDIDTIDDKSCPPQRQKRAKKNEIKTRNKLFSGFQFEESKQTSNNCQEYQQPQEYQLQVVKKQKRQSGCLLDKVDQKVNIFKKKLQYKDLNKDHKYKQDIRDKLKSIEEAQEINISVQVPKVFGGKHAHLEAAIYLKNKKQLSTQEKVDLKIKQSQGEEQSVVFKDRRQYYQELGKQVKLKKAETLTENILKQCFKKSQLQDLDFLPNLGFGDVRRESFDKRDQSQSILKVQLKENIKKSGSFEDSSFSGHSQIHNSRIQQNTKIQVINEIPQTTKQKQQNQFDSNQQIHQQEVKQQLQVVAENNIKDAKQKKKNQKVHRKKALKKNFAFSKYVQLQADISDDEQEGGPKHRDEGDDQSDDQEETQISSLIDDNVDFDSRDRGLIHRKYLQDMLEKEERQYKQMRQKMEKKYLEEQENLRKRMREAALKYKQKQEKEDSLFKEQLPLSNQNQQSNSKSNDIDTKLKNQAKLKELEQRLHLNKDIKEQTPRTEIIGTSKLKEIEAAVRITNMGPIKKAVRNGLQNMVAKKQKFKPKK